MERLFSLHSLDGGDDDCTYISNISSLLHQMNLLMSMLVMVMMVSMSGSFRTPCAQPVRRRTRIAAIAIDPTALGFGFPRSLDTPRHGCSRVGFSSLNWWTR